MLHRFLLAVVLLAAALMVLVPANAANNAKILQNLGGGPDKTSLTANEQRFVDLVNIERNANGAGTLTVAPLLVNIAREKSREMYELNYWGHVSPVETKRTAMRRVLYYLPQRPVDMTVGENLYYCSRVLIEEGHKALMESPTHRANIVNPVYDYIGVGEFKAPDGRYWVTQIFVDIVY